MTNPTLLSPAAQAVLDASIKHSGPAFEPLVRKLVSDALRAAAELLSKEVEAPKVDGSKYNGLWHSFDYLNAIADELEAQ